MTASNPGTKPELPITIDAGLYWIELACPQCAGREHVLIELAARLTVDDDAASIRPRLKAKAVDHICDQLSLTDADTAADADALPFDDETAEADQ